MSYPTVSSARDKAFLDTMEVCTVQDIFSIERPHPDLLKLYLIRSVLAGPLIVFVLPVLFFRYQTLKYRFDDEGISMSWGILFRQETNLTYARIQDIHVTSGLVQRWLGLADLQIQTASGSAAAEMQLEGLKEYEEIRDFLYNRMRGNRDGAKGKGGAGQAAVGSEQAVALLQEIHQDMKAVRMALEHNGGKG